MCCEKCGNQLQTDVRFCSDCGAQIQVGYYENPIGSVTCYAEFWKRFAAHIIDGIILSIAGTFLLLLLLPDFFSIGEITTSNQISEDQIIIIMIRSILKGSFMIGLFFIGNWLYFSIMESSASQATIGKMVLSIIVTDMKGNRLTFLRATGRYFAKILSSLIFYMGYIMAGFTEHKQALHDVLANTLVVDKKTL